MSSPQAPAPVQFRKGQILYRAGEQAGTIYLLQSGLVSLSRPAGGSQIEVAQVTAPQILGEELLSGSSVRALTATAVNDTQTIVIPLAFAQSAFDGPLPAWKLLIQGLIQKQASTARELLSIRLEGDSTPCPDSAVVRLFASIYHVASYNGTPKPDGSKTVVWGPFKKYAQRVFLESPVRIEQAVFILAKLGLASVEFVPSETDPDGEEMDIGFATFTDIELLRRFFEFFRSARRQGSVSDLLSDPSLPEADRKWFTDLLAEIEHWNREGRVASPLPPAPDRKAA